MIIEWYVLLKNQRNLYKNNKKCWGLAGFLGDHMNVTRGLSATTMGDNIPYVDLSSTISTVKKVIK